MAGKLLSNCDYQPEATCQSPRWESYRRHRRRWHPRVLPKLFQQRRRALSGLDRRSPRGPRAMALVRLRRLRPGVRLYGEGILRTKVAFAGNTHEIERKPWVFDLPKR